MINNNDNNIVVMMITIIIQLPLCCYLSMKQLPPIDLVLPLSSPSVPLLPPFVLFNFETNTICFYIMTLPRVVVSNAANNASDATSCYSISICATINVIRVVSCTNTSSYKLSYSVVFIIDRMYIINCILH